MLTITTQSNYLAKVVKLEGLRKHPNADKLQLVNIDFQQVVTGMDAKDGDIVVFFPVESIINSNFLAATNSYRHTERNVDDTKSGFFEDKGRVRAVRLRGEKSMGYFVPITDVYNFAMGTTDGMDEGWSAFAHFVGQEFDTINGIILCKKFVLPVHVNESREGQKPRASRIVEGQVHLHAETEQLRRNAFKISPDDEIHVSYKIHGTSWWVSNVLAKRKLSIKEKIAKFFGAKVVEEESDIFYGSRKVVKNEYETQETKDFYDGDLWKTIKEEVELKVPVGYTLYGEAYGYTEGGKAIQKDYDYGCLPGEHKLVVYRITVTNASGLVIDLSTSQMREFCERVNLPFIQVFYRGKARYMYPEIATENHWHEEWIKRLERDYTEKDCFICRNVVPEEGIVVRKEVLFGFEAYKLKSFAFLERETKLLDEENVNIEDNA